MWQAWNNSESKKEFYKRMRGEFENRKKNNTVQSEWGGKEEWGQVRMAWQRQDEVKRKRIIDIVDFTTMYITKIQINMHL